MTDKVVTIAIEPFVQKFMVLAKYHSAPYESISELEVESIDRLLSYKPELYERLTDANELRLFIHFSKSKRNIKKAELKLWKMMK